MPYLPDFRHDVFISYSMDNDAYTLDNGKWVSTFYWLLEARIKNKIADGGKDLKVFFAPIDHQAGNNLDDCLKAIAESATLVIIGSPRWMSDPWPKAEFAAFRRKFSDAGNRIYLAELEPPPKGQAYPDPLEGVLNIKFWKHTEKGNPTPFQDKTGTFDERLADFAAPIARTLEELKGKPRPAAKAPNPAFRKVLLAQTTDDLLDDVEALNSALRQLAIDVECNQNLPANGTDFLSEFGALADRAKIVVQLLSPHAGRRPSDLRQGYQQAQADAVRALPGKTLLQWRMFDPQQTEVRDQAHHLLVAGDGVKEGTIADLQREIVRLASLPPPPVRPADRRGIFLSYDPVDVSHAQRVVDECLRRGTRLSRPLHDEDQIKDWKAKYREAGKVVILHGGSSPKWYGGQVRLYGKATAKAQPDVRVLWLGSPEKVIADLPEYNPDFDIVFDPNDDLGELFEKIF